MPSLTGSATSRASDRTVDPLWTGQLSFFTGTRILPESTSTHPVNLSPGAGTEQRMYRLPCRSPSPQPYFRHRSGSPRSEEHTSELQSRGHLVCRLLLEK